MNTSNAKSSIEDIVDDARNGRTFILVDDDDCDGENSLVMPAQMATPDAINFMAQHGRGLICLAITAERARQLDLSLLKRRGASDNLQAFAVSIEARDGVTTGISAADRARTIAVAIDWRCGSDQIVSPGHVFPLVARDGGVLVRAGHTEAAIDVARLAGLNNSAVTCAIINDDGTLCRGNDLIAFAMKHGLKVCAIRNLIAYRRRFDHHIERRAELSFTSRWGGQWKALTFWNKASGTEHLAIIKGALDVSKPVMVRMHRMSHLTDVFAEESSRSRFLSGAMEMIAEEGSGVVVLVNRPMEGGMLSRLFQQRAAGTDVADLTDLAGVRDYGVGAQVLSELGIQQMILLTNSRQAMVALAGYGLSIVEQREIQGAGPE